MLGFGPIGYFAIGQTVAPRGNAVIFVISTLSFALTGNAATFQETLNTAAGAYSVSGVSQVLKGSFSPAAGAYALAGNAATFPVASILSNGVFAVSGIAQQFPFTFLGGTGAYSVALAFVFTTSQDTWTSAAHDVELWSNSPDASPGWAASAKVLEVWSSKAIDAEGWVSATVSPEPWVQGYGR